MIELGSQRHLFEVPADVAYFNTANMSPLLRAVREAGESGLARRARPWLVTSADWFEDVERLRGAYAAIIGADAGVRLSRRDPPRSSRAGRPHLPGVRVPTA